MKGQDQCYRLFAGHWIAAGRMIGFVLLTLRPFRQHEVATIFFGDGAETNTRRVCYPISVIRVIRGYFKNGLMLSRSMMA